eukprot:TRINITY_DN23055_c0_g1_i1.p1 TRINITY_DN23055_c0_g1~~TRINITY_DN23055_c0_g1_i1.p1  ORF type:complete len:236 (+),score=52.90 TRINITY_DN23055_c0_g1_i1:96-803(+)
MDAAAFVATRVSPYPSALSTVHGRPKKAAMARYVQRAAEAAEAQKTRVAPPKGHKVRAYSGMTGGSMPWKSVEACYNTYRNWFGALQPHERKCFYVTTCTAAAPSYWGVSKAKKVRRGRAFYGAACAMRANTRADRGVPVTMTETDGGFGGGGTVAAVCGMTIAGTAALRPSGVTTAMKLRTTGPFWHRRVNRGAVTGAVAAVAARRCSSGAVRFAVGSAVSSRRAIAVINNPGR